MASFRISHSSNGILVKQGAGILSLGGVSTYTGATSINDGTIQLTTGNNRLPTDTTVNIGQAGSANFGTLDLNGFNQQIAGLVSTSGMNAGTNKNTVTSTIAATLTLGGSGTYSYGSNTAANSGIITGAISLLKSGSGTQLLGGVNTYTGGTTVTGGTLGGTGTIGGPAVFQSSTIHSPGNSPGQQMVNGNYTLNSGSKLQVELNGTNAGSQYDQVVVNGAVVLNSPNLGIMVNMAMAPSIGSTFVLIDNDLSDGVTGKFNGLSEGKTFNVVNSGSAGGTYTFQISYVGGSGNDVVLTRVADQPLSENTAVDLISFTATHYHDGLWLTWQTGDEVDNLGFNVYRAQDGPKLRLNASLIAGSALRVGNGTHLVAGGNYAWSDESGNAQAQYWLEDVDVDGTSTWHGPIQVTAANSHATLQSSPLLGAAPLSQSGQFTRAAIANVDSSVEMPFALTAIPAGNQAQQWALAAGQAVKIAVRKTGWYRVTKAQLSAAGLNVTDFNTLQLYAEGQPVPFSSGSNYFEFYGVAFDTPTTDTHIYWLVAGSGGARIASQASGAPGTTFAVSFPCTVQSKPRSIYYSSLLNGEADNFFGSVLAAQPVQQPLTVQNPASSGLVTLEVALQGVSAGAHRVSVQFNGTALGSVTFSDRSHKTALFTVPLAALTTGSNTVTLTAAGGTDVSLLDSLRLTYPRSYRAVNDRLTFSAQSDETIRIEGFSLGTAPLRLLDVSDPANPVEIQGQVQTNSNDRSLTFKASATSSRLIAFAAGQFDSPATVVANQSSDWHQAKSADLVIIAHGSVKSSVEPLAALRRQQGYAVQVVDVEDLYDEFSGGAHTPQAIKDFLANAKTKWAKSPRFGLLVGDSSLDPRDYIGQGNFDLVPTRLIDTSSMETASDEWLADFNNDGLAEVSLGRLPVRSVAEANSIISKIVGYAGFQVKEGQKALFVSDTARGFDFNAASSTVAGLVSPAVSKQFIKRDDGDAATVKAQLLQSINQGPLLTSFFGHGSVDIWTGARLLSNEDANSLATAIIYRSCCP